MERPPACQSSTCFLRAMLDKHRGPRIESRSILDAAITMKMDMIRSASTSSEKLTQMPSRILLSRTGPTHRSPSSPSSTTPIQERCCLRRYCHGSPRISDHYRAGRLVKRENRRLRPAFALTTPMYPPAPLPNGGTAANQRPPSSRTPRSPLHHPDIPPTGWDPGSNRSVK